MANENSQNHGEAWKGGEKPGAGNAPNNYGDVVQSILGDLANDSANLRATIAQRAPYATPQQVEQIAAAVQARLGSAALTPAADQVVNDVLAALAAAGAFAQAHSGYSGYPQQPTYPSGQQYPSSPAPYPYGAQPYPGGAQPPYPYQPQTYYPNAPNQPYYPQPSSFNYVPQAPQQSWSAPNSGANPAFPYAQPPQTPPSGATNYYAPQGYPATPSGYPQQPVAQPPQPAQSHPTPPTPEPPVAPQVSERPDRADPASSIPSKTPVVELPPEPPTSTQDYPSPPQSSERAQSQPSRATHAKREKPTQPIVPSQPSTSSTASTRPASSRDDARKSTKSEKREEKRPRAADETKNKGKKEPKETTTPHAKPSRESRAQLTTLAASTPAPVADLATLATAAQTNNSNKPASLATLSANANTATLNLNTLATSNARVVSTDAFLQLLGRHAPKQQSGAATLDLLNNESSLEKAREDAPMWLMSLALHIAIALLLALLVWKTPVKNAFEVVSEPGFRDEVVLDEVFDPDASFEMNEEVEIDTTNAPEVDTNVQADVPDVSAFAEDVAAPLSITETAVGLEAPLGEVDNLLGSLMGDDLSGRGDNKAAALATGGGSEGSEKSVALALAWLAEHQNPDGSWSYDLRACPKCRGACGNSGTNGSKIAATAMGILPFLAAGHTPTQGKYKRVVADGLNFLLDQGKEEENGLSYRDGPGNMYAHGLATITLCETYAMLSDREKQRYRRLGYMAQSAVNYIEWAQADDGGWRYTPKQAGDTSVFGWQMMALKSASLGGLEVDDYVIRGARNFLRDVVSFDDESRYYYCNRASESHATTAIGLLCRLYLDWRTNNPKLLRGSAIISGIGPEFGNPYYNYYAAQLMHNVGGAMWQKWNQQTRDALCAAQIMDGHERGSWFPQDADGHCVMGGRLYATSLNCMVLEVYYRHMPLYQRMEETTRFPIEVLGGEPSDASNDAATDDVAEDLGELDETQQEAPKEASAEAEDEKSQEADKPENADAPREE